MSRKHKQKRLGQIVPRGKPAASERAASNSLGHRWSDWALAIPFLALAVAVTWPLATVVDEAVPLGSEEIATVPLFNLWTLAWNVEALGSAGYWDAPIFHPATNTLVFSEPQPLPGALALLASWLGASPITIYNLILLLALTTNGWLSAVVLGGAGMTRTASFGGGVLVALMPFTHQELGVLQLVPLGGVLAGAAGLWRFAQRPGWRSGVLLGLGWAVALAISFQTAVFGVLALLPAAVYLCWTHVRSARAWVGTAVAAAVALALVAPILVAQSQAFSEESFARSARTQASLSAEASDFFESAWPPLLPIPGVKTAERPGARAFWPGAGRVFLALAACVLAWRRPKWRRLVIAMSVVVLWSFLLSQAGRVDLAPVDALRSLPGLAQVRSWYRFAMFAQLGLCVLAALGLHFVARCLAERGKRLAVVGVLGLVSIAALDVRPDEFNLQTLPPIDLELRWLAWVVEKTQQDDVLAFVPFPEGRSAAHYLGTTQWMYWQLRHWRPMVNGYSGFFPQSFRRLRDVMQDFPSDESLEALSERGVRYCIVHRAFVDLPEELVSERGGHRLRRVFRDAQHALDVYELDSSR